jgi:hypothetical protein
MRSFALPQPKTWAFAAPRASREPEALDVKKPDETKSLAKRKQGGLGAVATKGGSRRVMRNGQNKRMRGRNRKSQNPMTRVFESNGPDVKIRGTPSHVAEKYLQLARDAQTSGDPVAAENYFQHAEHYFRLIAAAQEQFRQTNPQFYRGDETRDDGFDDGEDSPQGMPGPGEVPFGPGEPQPYLPREAQPYPAREPQAYHQPREQQAYPAREQQSFAPREQQTYAPRAQPPAPIDGDVDRLPSFITGGQQPQPQPGQNQPSFGQNGHENQGDRFPLHRRRRRHRGPRHESQGAAPSGGGEGDDSRGNE